jgi:tyrosinase
VTLQVTTRGPDITATLKTRQSVSELSADELTAFRAGITGLLGRRDNRGYQYYAGWHGVPDGICQHHNSRFLPWHRGYLYHVELALQDIDDSLTLPWWNWLDEAGLPTAYADEKVGNDDNVLFSVPIEPMGVPQQDGWPKQTHREPLEGGGPSPYAPPLRQFEEGPNRWVDTWKWLMGATSYDEFNQRCWRVHDNIHGWVGGEMNDPNWAAYDPIFWAHHSMVDRLWRIWQHDNPGANPGADIIDVPMTFGKAPALTPRQVLDVKQLGYDYSAQTATVAGTAQA